MCLNTVDITAKWCVNPWHILCIYVIDKFKHIDKHILLGVTAGTSESSATQGRTGEVPPATTGVRVALILSH